MADLKELAARLDVQASNLSGNRAYELRSIADELWQEAGGRPSAQATGDSATTPTKGPGVRAPAEPVTVDSVGAIGNKPPVDTRSQGRGPDNPPLP